MPRSSVRRARAAPGLAIERLYLQVLPGTGQPLEVVARSLQVEPEVLRERLAALADMDVVSVDDGVLHVVPPRAAVARFVAHHADHLSRASMELRRLADVFPLMGEGDRPVGADATAIAGEISTSGDVPSLLTTWIAESEGDVCFLRPDQWQLPSESAMAVAVGRAVAGGRRVRAIYPARALREAPEVLASRAAIGEQVRLAPDVVTRLAIVGPERALVPEPLGRGSSRRLVLRQPSLVMILQSWFDQMWDRADVVRGLDAGRPRPDMRRMLLTQMADGVTDEVIARNLDVSLRTVRRRIAALMEDLGVDTRFQAGMEAVRRGWL